MTDTGYINYTKQSLRRQTPNPQSLQRHTYHLLHSPRQRHGCQFPPTVTGSRINMEGIQPQLHHKFTFKQTANTA